MLRKIAVLLAALFSFVSIATSITPAEASGDKYGDMWDVEELQPWSIFDSEIPKNLAWPKSSLQLAGKAQGSVKNALEDQIASLARKGAKKIRQVFTSKGPNLPKTWLSYVPEIRNYYLIGYADGKEIARSTLLPKANWPVASRLVRLEKQNCKPIEFAIFNFESWFSDLCSIKLAPNADYLRSSIWEFHTSPHEDLRLEYTVQFYWMQLLACSSWDQPYTIKNGVYTCPFNQPHFGASSFKLSYLGGQGGYKFNIKPEVGKVTIALSAPDYLDYAKHAWLSKGSMKITFRSTEP